MGIALKLRNCRLECELARRAAVELRIYAPHVAAKLARGEGVAALRRAGEIAGFAVTRSDLLPLN